MAKAKKVAIALPDTYQAQIEVLKAQLLEATTLRTSLESDLRAKMAANWNAVGGCQTCHGRRWVVEYDTMDCMDGSYASYGTCKNPSCSDALCQATGPSPAFFDKYDRQRLREDPFRDSQVYKVMFESMLQHEADLDLALITRNHQAELRVPKTVVVTKGRKVPVGTIGRLVAFYYNSYDHRTETCRAKIECADGSIHYTNADNLAVTVDQSLDTLNPPTMSQEPLSMTHQVVHSST